MSVRENSGLYSAFVPDAGFPMKILPTATWLAKWMACLGLVCGVLYSVGGLVYDMLTIGLNWGTAMAFMALVGVLFISPSVSAANPRGPSPPPRPRDR